MTWWHHHHVHLYFLEFCILVILAKLEKNLKFIFYIFFPVDKILGQCSSKGSTCTVLTAGIEWRVMAVFDWELLGRSSSGRKQIIWYNPKNCFKIYFLFIWKTEKKRDRYLSSTDSLPECPQQQDWVKPKTGAWNSFQVPHVGVRDSSTCHHCLPGCTFAGSWKSELPGLKPHTQMWMWYARLHLNHCARCPSQQRALSLAVKMPISHIRVCGFSSWLQLLTLAPAKAHPGRQ